MGNINSPLLSKRLIASQYTIAALLVVAFLFGFRPDHGYVDGDSFRRALRILTRLWFFSAPAGTLLGIFAAYLILRSSWLSQATVRLLHVGRWAPLLIWWVLAVQLIVSPQDALPGTWLWTYGSVTVALTACYQFIVCRFMLRLSVPDTLVRVVIDSAIQGILVALFLSLTIWVGQFWVPYAGKSQIGYKVFIVLAALILLVNWASGYTFDRAAAERGAAVIEELKYDNWSSFFGALILVMLCLLVWQAFTGFIFRISPSEMLIGLYEFFGGEFFRDIYVSLGEIVLGLMLSGITAAFLHFVLNQVGKLKSIVDTILQALQIAPIALLPGLMGSSHLFLHKWSAFCVAVFSFYGFARAFWGLRYYSILPRILLSLDDALPYSAAAIVYGEAMNATAGLSFSMVVAGAVYQTAKGLGCFVTLLFLVAALSTLLRWVAKTSLRRSLTVS